MKQSSQINKLKKIRYLNEKNPFWYNLNVYRLIYNKEALTLAYKLIKSVGIDSHSGSSHEQEVTLSLSFRKPLGHMVALSSLSENETLDRSSSLKINNLHKKLQNQAWKPKQIRKADISKQGKLEKRPLRSRVSILCPLSRTPSCAKPKENTVSQKEREVRPMQQFSTIGPNVGRDSSKAYVEGFGFCQRPQACAEGFGFCQRPQALWALPKAEGKELCSTHAFAEGVEEKIVQTALKMVLQAIYQPSFMESALELKGERGREAALESIQKNFNGMVFAIRGEI